MYLGRRSAVESGKSLPNPGNPLRSELDTGDFRPGTALGPVGYPNLPAVGFGDYLPVVDVGDEQPCPDDVRAGGCLRYVRDAMPDPRNSLNLSAVTILGTP